MEVGSCKTEPFFSLEKIFRESSCQFIFCLSKFFQIFDNDIGENENTKLNLHMPEKQIFMKITI